MVCLRKFTVSGLCLKNDIKTICGHKSCAQLQHKNKLPNNQLKQEVPILQSFRGSWQTGKLCYVHADKYKISKLSTCCNLVGLITLQCLFGIAPREVSTKHTSSSQILLVIKQLLILAEKVVPGLKEVKATMPVKLKRNFTL